MNEIMIDGEIIKIGATPAMVTSCGFKSPLEVGRAALKFSSRAPHMGMDDVAEWFKDNVKQN